MVAFEHTFHLSRDLTVGDGLLVVDDLEDVVDEFVEEVTGNQGRLQHELGFGKVFDHQTLI